MFRKFIIYLYSFKVLRRVIPSLLRIMSAFNFHQKIQIMNFKILLYLASSIDREIFLKGSYETNQINYVLNILSEDSFDYFFDVGAYIGYYSLVVNHLVKNTAAFEPNNLNYSRLKKNVEINKFNISCHNYACSDKKAQRKLWFTDKNKRGGSSVLTVDDQELKKYNANKIFYETINCIKLDDLFELTNKKLFFKIDVERHELNVLNGALNLLLNNSVFMQIEIFPHLRDEILNFLNHKNFKLLKNINNDYYLKNF